MGLSNIGGYRGILNEAARAHSLSETGRVRGKLVLVAKPYTVAS
jgi:hypothetical protein